MNLNHLKYFYDAVSQGQISAAARKNRISQSAVSQAIGNLEKTLQCRLLVHQRKRLELTDAGKVAYEECKKVFDSIETFHQNVTQNYSGYRGELNLAASNG